MGRTARISLSLANLVYLRAWADLIPLGSDNLFYRKSLPDFRLYFALIGDVLALALLIFLLIRIAPRVPSWLRRALPVAAIAILAFAFSFLRAHLPHLAPVSVLAVLFVAAEILAYKFSTRTVRIIKGLALAATPCLAVTFLAPIYYLSRPSPIPPDPPLAHRLNGSPAVRVIWVIFDEWDQRLTFGDADTPSAAPVPTIASLSARSFIASRALAAQSGAVPVYNMATALAIPSLLYGKLAIAFGTEDASTRNLLFTGESDPTVLGSGNSVFARARSLGWNSAIAGWFLPYCRIFASQVTDCYWDEMFDQASSASRFPVQAAVDETRMLFESEMYSPFGRSLVVARHTGEYQALLAAAKRYAADAAIGLAFIHLNVPHKPYLDNPGLRSLVHTGQPDALYIKELRWVDNAVAEILCTLDNSGLASKTAVILSSDHPARLASRTTPYVPFIVHLPGYAPGVTSSLELSTLGSADLVMAIANGQIHSPLDIENFLVRRQ